MIKQKNDALGIVLLFVLAALTLNVNPAFARIDSNGAGTGYGGGDPPPEGGTAYDGSITIENYIEVGIGYYLTAKGDVDGLLAMVESQGNESVSLDQLRTSVESALANMGNAVATFDELIEKAETTPYNPHVIAILNEFDYDGFGLNNGLNSVIFAEVEGYLKEGDITGAFKRKRTDFHAITTALNGIKSEIENNNVPGLPGLWEMNETFSGSSLFGSYVARVFKEINE
ncbi:MAG: hypothetical protein GY940_15660 [bacterium]|nr:hypothetical protein [bacterium]